MQKANLGFNLWIWALPWFLLLVSYSMNPKYLTTLFSNIYGLTALVCMLLWETLGCCLLERGGNPPSNSFARLFYISPKNVIVVLVFVLPAIVLVMLGPVVVTLLDATLAR